MMEPTRHTIKTERAQLAPPQGGEELPPQQRHHAAETPGLACRVLGHARISWPEVPALSMCSRCYTSWVEVQS